MPGSNLGPLLEQAQGDDDVMAVFLFGSTARAETAPRDVDICLVLDERAKEPGPRKRIEYLKKHDVDLHIFQDLPLPVRQRVLKEGKILLSKNEDLLYDLAAKTIRSCTYFRHIYETYLEGVQTGP